MSAFQESKLALMSAVGLGRDALHIYVGLSVMLIAAALFRLPLRDWRPWTAALLAALAGEAWDLIDTAPGRRLGLLPRSWHDLWNTMFWPTVLLLLARYTKLLKR
jgi:hypothetical protein